MKVEQWPIDKVIAYARNPRTKNKAAVAKVAASLKEFSFRQPLVVDKDGVLVVGHTRLEAAHKLGLTEVPVHVAADLTPAQAKAYRLADNRTHEEASWDQELLGLEVEELVSAGFDIALTGFDEGELEGFDDESGGRAGGEVSDGSLLSLLDVSISDPRHEVMPGECWSVGPHLLICCSVMKDWGLWAPELEADSLFVPYPGPFVPLGSKAEHHRLVMVQPDTFLAGHLLDRYAEVNGEGEVRRR